MYKQDEYMKCLSKYLICDIDMYDNNCVKIFKNPVILIFFWLDKSSGVFFSIYKYKDTYVLIQDLSGNLYDYLKDESEQDSFSEMVIYLFKNLDIYTNLDDIRKSIKNTSLLEEFTHFINKWSSQGTSFFKSIEY
jgi:hypothetical protein